MSESDAQRLAIIREQRGREVNEPHWQKVKHFAWIDMDLVLRLLDSAHAHIAELERERDTLCKANEQHSRNLSAAHLESATAIRERDALQAELVSLRQTAREAAEAEAVAAGKRERGR